MPSNYLQQELENLFNHPAAQSFFLEQYSDGFWFWDLEQPQNQWISDNFWRLLGYPPEEFTHSNKCWMSTIDEDNLSRANIKIKEYLSSDQQYFDQVIKHKHQNGTGINLRCRGFTIKDTASGKAKRMFCTHQKIDSFKKSSATPLQDAIFKTVTYGIMAFRAQRNDDYEIIDFIWEYSNPAGTAMTKRSEQELLGQKMLDLFPGIKVSGLFQEYIQTIETGETYNTEVHYSYDGFDEWHAITAIKYAPDAIAISFTPITHLKNQKRRIEQLNEDLKSLALATEHDLTVLFSKET